MRKIAVFMLFVGSIFAFDQAKFDEGKELFKRCAPCHGEFGEKQALGRSSEISNLDEKSISEVLKVYAKGGTEGAMKAQGSLLDDKKIASLSTYIAYMTYAHGKEIFDTRCVGCHGADGQKSAFGKSGSVAKMNEAQLLKVINQYKSGKFEKGTTEEAMRGRALNLTDLEVNALAKYISTLGK